ncbi:MAG: DUF2520 domain-containing protein [Bacteroides sp.]|nr:DUF2520 domain-containing protein [Bacteroides sp.]MCM1084800.1 DUF2520 domain-containing protein [Bacteroides sp.]
MKAVLLGSGNAAWHIAPALRVAGVEWVQVYSRTLAHAERLSARLGGVPFTSGLSEIDPCADLYLLAVSDQALFSLAEALRLPGKTVAHVSGSMPLSVLRPVSEHRGVLYFFQTFSREAPAPDLSRTPVCVEASDGGTERLLKDLAEKVSDKVCVLDSGRRETLHIGGVFVNNFVNLMYTAASDLFREKGMDFSLLHPLMEQTLCKAMRMPPAKAQTGPAARGEEKVLREHLRYLEASEQGGKYVQVYRLLSQAIQNIKTEDNGEL